MKYNLIIMIAVLLLSCMGCTAKEENKTVEITLMHGWGGTLKTHKTMQEIYAGFSRENPDIILKCIPYSSNSIAVEKANDMLALGRMPDLISTNGLSYFVENAVSRGMALDLMPYILGDEEFRKEIHPFALETWTQEGEIYTLPDALEVAGYWYNKKYFLEAGLADANGNPKLPLTWEDFFKSAKILNRYAKEKGITVFSLEDSQILEYFALARIAGEGEAGMKMAAGNPDRLDENVLNKVADDVKNLYQYSKNAINIEDARQNFYEGESIIYFNGVWESDLLLDSPILDEIGYANYPGGEGKTLSYLSPSSGYVVGKSIYPEKNEACIRFLKYILSEKVQTKLALETGQAPSNPNFDQEELLLKTPLLGNAVKDAYAADLKIKTINSIWSNENLNALSDYLYHSLQNIK